MSDATRTVPSAFESVVTLAGVTFKRLVRGKAIWICLAIAVLPLIFATIVHGDSKLSKMLTFEVVVVALLAPFLVASAIGDDIEDRTLTYVWSRPLPRWTYVVGKLVAVAPIALVTVLGSWVAACEIGAHTAPWAWSYIGLGAGTLSVSCVAAGIATLAPKYGTALSVSYMLMIDLVIGEIPANLQSLSIGRAAREIAKHDHVGSSFTTLIVFAGIWLALGLLRIRKLEA